MVVDDIVVVGARPLFMTDYIACGKVVPERIADHRRRHRPRVRRDRHGARRRRDGRAPRPHGSQTTTTSPAPPSARSRRMPCSGPSACSTATWWSRSRRADCTATASRWCAASSPGAVSATPTTSTSSAARSARRCSSRPGSTRRRWSGCSTTFPDAVHALSHVTGGGIAANLARVLPQRVVGRARSLDLEPAAGVPGARGVGRPLARRDRGHLEPRRRDDRGRRRRMPRARSRTRSPHPGCRPGSPDASRSARATSTASSRVPRASTAEPCGWSAPTPAE